MKINLLLDNKDGVLNGYLNIDPLSENCPSRIAGDVSNLDFICDNGEVEEILAYNIIEYFHFSLVDGIFNNWLSKLKVGGKLFVSIIDINELSRIYYLNKINLDKFNNIIFGEQKKNWDTKKCGLTVYNLTEVLENKGYKILKSEINGYEGLVACERVK